MTVVTNLTTYYQPFFDNVLLEHGGLPHALPLIVHRVGRGGHSESLLLFEFFIRILRAA